MLHMTLSPRYCAARAIQLQKGNLHFKHVLPDRANLVDSGGLCVDLLNGRSRTARQVSLLYLEQVSDEPRGSYDALWTQAKDLLS